MTNAEIYINILAKKQAKIYLNSELIKAIKSRFPKGKVPKGSPEWFTIRGLQKEQAENIRSFNSTWERYQKIDPDAKEMLVAIGKVAKTKSYMALKIIGA